MTVTMVHQAPDASRPSTFPDEMPNLGFCGHGWLRAENERVLRRFLGPEVKTIVEIGTWLGLSARFMLDHAPNATLYAVDHWEGLPELEWQHIAPDPWAQFTRDCWNYRKRIVPVRMRSSDGIEHLADRITPDLIYLDGGHDYEVVADDIRRIQARWPGVLLIADDWDWDGVRRAAEEAYGARLNVEGNCWWVEPQR